MECVLYDQVSVVVERTVSVQQVVNGAVSTSTQVYIHLDHLSLCVRSDDTLMCTMMRSLARE